MSDPQRYTLALPEISYGMDESNKGEYVLWRDYASLKAEVEFLRKQYSEAVGQFRPMRIENENLKAEVERLRKAGDAMAEEIIGCYKGEGYDPKDSETLPKWNAAKEGKPSV